MYDLNKRSYFTTLGELRMLLADLPNETEVCTGGVLGSYLHFDKDKDLISFDDEDLGPDYDLDYPEYYGEDELYLKRQVIEDKQLFYPFGRYLCMISMRIVHISVLSCCNCSLKGLINLLTGQLASTCFPPLLVVCQ